MPDTCICCGAVIPEGRQICLRCEREEQSPEELEVLLRETLPVLRAAFFANWKLKKQADELYDKITKVVGKE